MSYYHRFKIIIGSPLWRFYLRWAYGKCIEDLDTLHFIPDFNNRDFTCLLCGVGNETTADEFIQFANKKNLKAKIIIIDLGKEQIQAVKNLIRKKYLSHNIEVKQIDALQLTTFIKPNSINWIETDGFLEFFDKKSLNKLMQIWNKILKNNGFITLREPASEGKLGQITDNLRIWIGKRWLGITIYRHTKQELNLMFQKSGFKYVTGYTSIPTFKRYSLIKF